MLDLVLSAGYGPALASLADVIAVQVAGPPTEEVERRMNGVAKITSVELLDAMVSVARRYGWKGAQ
jgi:hypothetical protein